MTGIPVLCPSHHVSGKGGFMNFVPKEIGSHDYFVRCAALSPSRHLLATGDEDCIVKVWAVPEGGTGLTLKGHRDAIYCMQFLTDQILATGSWDRTVRLWDTKTGGCIRVMRGHFDRLERIGSCLKIGRIVSADESGEVCEFDLRDGSLQHRWRTHENRVRAITMFKNHGWLSTGDDGRIMMREWTKPSPTQRCWLQSAGYGINGPMFDGRWIVLGSDGNAFSLNLKTGNFISLLKDVDYLRSQDISPCGYQLACGGKSGFLQVWEGENSNQAFALEVGESILEVGWLSSTVVVGCGRNGLVFAAHKFPKVPWQLEKYSAYSDHFFSLAIDILSGRFYTAGFDG